MLLLQQNNTKKKQVNKLFLQPKPDLEVGGDKKYKMEGIQKNVANTNKEKS